MLPPSARRSARMAGFDRPFGARKGFGRSRLKRSSCVMIPTTSPSTTAAPRLGADPFGSNPHARGPAASAARLTRLQSLPFARVSFLFLVFWSAGCKRPAAPSTHKTTQPAYATQVVPALPPAQGDKGRYALLVGVTEYPNLP